jgi:FKBP-type peptidyl-prolyl cis-trans isomerase FklB
MFDRFKINIMRKTIFLVCTLICLMVVTESSAQKGRKKELTNSMDTISYTLGVSIAVSVQQRDLPEINIEKLLMAIEDVLANQKTEIPIELSQTLINDYLKDLKEKRELEKLEEMAVFLDENKKEIGVVTLPSGLQYKIINEGEGQSPTRYSKVKTHYKGTLMDGTVFDSSYERDEPIEFGVKQVIRGWQEALLLMKPGAKWILYIPPYLGYGNRNSGAIPPNSVLIFEFELISFE